MATTYTIDHNTKIRVALPSIRKGRDFTWKLQFHRGATEQTAVAENWPAGSWVMRVSKDPLGLYKLPPLIPVSIEGSMMIFDVDAADNIYNGGETYYCELVNTYESNVNTLFPAIFYVENSIS
jgi:hypothetical protein